MEARKQYYRIAKEIASSDIDWKAVESVLEAHAKIPLRQSRKLVRRLQRELELPLNPLWHRNSKERDSVLVPSSVLCGILGADELLVHAEHTIRIVGIEIGLKQVVHLAATEALQRYPAEIRVFFFNIELTVTQFWQVVLLRLLLLCLGVLFYVLLVGCVLYGISAGWVLLVEPELILDEAHRSGRIYLGIVCMIIAAVVIIRMGVGAALKWFVGRRE